MCPAEAKVVIFEDGPDLRKIMTRNLQARGHTVVAEASSMEEARELIPQLDNLGVQVAVVDGNLRKWAAETAGKDGAEIARGIKELNPKIAVVGWSDDIVEGVDIRFGKHNYEIYSAIESL